MIKLYGYSALTEEDYLSSPIVCSEYVSGSNPHGFFKIMSNKTVLCFNDQFGKIDYEPNALLEKFIEDLHSIDLLSLINNVEPPALNRSEVPLINSISSINPLIKYMAQGSSLTFLSAGDLLCDTFSKDTAKMKAGEIHLKLLSSMGLGDLLLITPRQCHINLLGKHYASLQPRERDELLRKLLIKIPIVSTLLRNATLSPTSISRVISSAQITGTTIGRRSSSVKAIIDFIDQTSDTDVHKLCSKIYV